MRRSEIIEGVNQILEAIEKSNIIRPFQESFGGERNSEKVTVFLSSLRDYSILSNAYNSAARNIATILKIEFLENPKFWTSVSDLSNKTRTGTLARSYENLLFAKTYLPSIIQLLDREYLSSTRSNNEPIFSNGKEMKLLSVTVFENDKRLSSPQRLIQVLESIDIFYTSCAYMTDESPDTLSVVGCDSGSDKSFDFLGVAKVMECVTQLIESLWDRVVFYREKQLEVRLDLINKSLPIYEKLNELETGKKIEPELAERLRRNLSEGVNKFVESGASIPEIDAHSTYNSRSLLSPVQKLLVSAPEEMEETTVQKTTETQSTVFNDIPSEKLETNNLSSDEQTQLLELLKKMKESPQNQANDAENEADFVENDE